jgi:trehalose-phosphatase
VGELGRLIAPLADAPGESAVLLDVDGTLAPIAGDPADAMVPGATREALRSLARSFGLVACISGRRAVEARRLVGVGELTYAGNHGLELLRPGEEAPSLDPALGGSEGAARGFLSELGAASWRGAGLRLEDKGPIQALHWRGAADEAAAERGAREIASRASGTGLEVRWGRKVLELRPGLRVDKGTAVLRLLDGRGLTMALFAGDDRTDLDAFRALRSLAESGELRRAVCIGVASSEAPAELAEGADALVDGPDQLAEVLGTLAERTGAGADRD